MMTVNESLVCSFQILKPLDKSLSLALEAQLQLSLVLQQDSSKHFLVLKHDMVDMILICNV
uniref:Uncharacterized protein n=1 Tax=Medicago truncatula TaxID=3880 RepID=B7FI32_MEDTR|nr:unknown [Medicago truncatula]AFK41744.1 unknown [Medicago truncatula]